jgi:exosortase/archaeosortase family protein
MPWVVKLALAGSAVGLVVWAGTERIRRAEAGAAAWLSNLIGAPVKLGPFGALVAIPQPDRPFFLAEITASCSGIAAGLIVLCLGLLITRAQWTRSLLAVGAGVVLALSLNLIRIVTALVAGSKIGRTGFFLAHDWVGTFVSLFAIGLALLVVMRMNRGSRQHQIADANEASPAVAG